MQRHLFMASLAFGAMLLTAYEASAQNRVCALRDIVIERLADNYKESRQIIALNGDRMMMELFASNETGTWTITLTRPNGLTCIMAAGESYQHVAEGLPQAKEDA